MAATHYIEITIVASKVDEAIPVIPVFLSPADTTFWSTVTGQNDVVFKDSTGTTTLSHYRVAFTDSGTTGTGCYLVNVSSVISASTDVTIRLYFGDSGASDTSDGSATFSSTDIEAFYLPGMGLAPVGPALTAVNAPGTAASDFEGVTAADYNGSTQYHWQSGALGITDYPLTLEVLAYNDTNASNATTLYIDEASGSALAFLYQGSSATNVIHRNFFGGGVVSSGAYAISTWRHIVATRDSETSGTSRQYVDGSADGTGTANAYSLTGYDRLSIGARYNGSADRYFDGRVAVAAIHSAERSANWISTSNKAWTDSGFLTWGSSTEISTSGNTDYEELTAAADSEIAVGDEPWTNASNFLTSLASAATVDIPDGGYSRRISLTNPDGALDAVGSNTVTGIAVEVIGTGEDGGSGASERIIYDEEVYLIISGSVAGDNKADAAQWTDASDVTRIYGGEFDTWGLSEAQRAGSNFTASNFGVALRYYNDSASEAALFSGKRVRVKLWWGGEAAADTTAFFLFFD